MQSVSSITRFYLIKIGLCLMVLARRPHSYTNPYVSLEQHHYITSYQCSVGIPSLLPRRGCELMQGQGRRGDFVILTLITGENLLEKAGRKGISSPNFIREEAGISSRIFPGISYLLISYVHEVVQVRIPLPPSPLWN